MRYFTVTLKFLKIYSLFALPGGAVGFLLANDHGLRLTLISIAAVILLVTLLSEAIIIRLYRANSSAPPGLEQSLRWSSVKTGRLPRLRVIQEPLWRVEVIRSPFRRGTILLSQGLVALLNERDLRMILKECVRLNSDPDTIFQSLRTVLLLSLLKLMPSKKVTPFAMLRFLLLFPLLNVLRQFKAGISEENLPILMRQGCYRAARPKDGALALLGKAQFR